jgi:hypothetical protein
MYLVNISSSMLKKMAKYFLNKHFSRNPHYANIFSTFLKNRAVPIRVVQGLAVKTLFKI